MRAEHWNKAVILYGVAKEKEESIKRYWIRFGEKTKSVVGQVQLSAVFTTW